MKKIDMIVKAPYFFTMCGEGVGFRNSVSMLVDGGKILGFIPNSEVDKEYKAFKEFNLNNHAIFPGFIDAHMHTKDNIFRGLAQDTKNWMMYGLQPFQNAADEKSRQAGSKIAMIEAIKAGTTTFGDFNEQMDENCYFIEKLGVRGNIAQLIRSAKSKVYKVGELYEFDKEKGEASLVENIKLYNKWHNKADGRIRILFGPQGADFLDLDLLLKVRQVAIERKTKIHMHVQQGDRETYQITKRYGKRPTNLLEDIGYLDNNLIAVHLTDCTDEETRVIAKHGAGMIVNPASIGIIDGIVCPSVEFQKAGGNVALGSDQAPGNNCHNIIHEMKNVCLFNKIKFQDPEVMPAWKALRMATIEGAKAIGIDDIVGSLEEGKQADFIAVNLNVPSMLPVYNYPMRNIVPNLVYSARGSEVDFSVVNGNIVMENRKLVNIDEDSYIEGINKFSDDIGKKAAAEFFDINGTNNKFMKEEKL